MLQSYLISSLSARHRASDLSAFAAEYPEAWLVWEAGPWIPGGKGKTGMVTAVGSAFGSARPPTPVAEVLATHLRIDPKHPTVILGRDDSAAININDATLSRAHLIFTRAPDGWLVDDAGSSNGSWLNGVRLTGSAPQRLINGIQLQAGKVFLTYYQAVGMLERIKASAR